MNKYYLLFVAFITCAILFFNSPTKTNKTSIAIGALEKSSAKNWQEFEMLKDPTTGKIPDHIRLKELAFVSELFPSYQNKTTADDWTQRGPWNVGGRTRALAMDITNDQILLAASVSGAIYRTTDGGDSWTSCSKLDQHPGIVTLSQDMRAGKQNIWYALSGEPTGTSASASGAFFFGDGLYKSIDSGKNWTPIASTSSGVPSAYSVIFQVGYRVKISPKTNADILYSANLYGISISKDGGNTWQIARGDFSNPITYYTDVELDSVGNVYCTLSSDDAGVKGIWRSSDDSTWADITPYQYINNFDRIVMNVNPNNQNEVYFMVYMEDSIGNPGAVKTSNYKGTPEYIALLKYTYLNGDGTGNGGQWINLSSNLPLTGGPFDKINCQGSYDMCVKVQPKTNNVYIGGTNIYVSTDGFTSPNNTRFIGGYKPGTILPFFEIYPFHHPDQHDIVFSKTDTSVVWSASDGGVRKTNNIYNTPYVTWENKNNGYFSSQYYTVTIDKSKAGDPYLLGGFQDNGNFITNTFNLQHQWKMPVNGDGAYNYIAPNRDFYIMSIQLGKMVKCSLDHDGNLISFKRIDPIGPNHEIDYLFINPFEVDPNDNNIMYVPAGKYLYRQNQLKNLPLDNQYDSISTGWFKFTDSVKLTNGKITAIGVSKTPANIIYLGTNTKKIYKITNANVGDSAFKDITPTIFPAGYISCIAVDQKDGNKVLVVFSNYSVHSLFYTVNGGTTWSQCGGNIETNTLAGYAPSVRWASIVDLPNNGKKYLIGTSVGVFSADSLKTNTLVAQQTQWVKEGQSTIGNAVVPHITWRNDGYVVLGTHGNGAFAKSFGWPVNNPMIEQESVIQVFPNPCYTQIQIQMNKSIQKISKVEIQDILGRWVYSPNFESDNSGLIRVNTSSLMTGLYILHFSVDGKSYNQRFIKN